MLLVKLWRQIFIGQDRHVEQMHFTLQKVATRGGNIVSDVIEVGFSVSLLDGIIIVSNDTL